MILGGDTGRSRLPHVYTRHIHHAAGCRYHHSANLPLSVLRVGPIAEREHEEPTDSVLPHLKEFTESFACHCSNCTIDLFVFLSGYFVSQQNGPFSNQQISEVTGNFPSHPSKMSFTAWIGQGRYLPS